MERITFKDGRASVPLQGPLSLPDPMTIDFLHYTFDCDVDDPAFVARLHERLPAAEKECFEKACRAIGMEAEWSQAALDWASVGADDGKWDLRVLGVIYVEPISTWLVDQIIATHHGGWYAVTPKHGVMTRMEFGWRYGQDLTEHLKRYLSLETLRVSRLLLALEQDFVQRQIQVSVDEGLKIVTRTGPATIPPSEWQLQPGETFLCTLDLEKEST